MRMPVWLPYWIVCSAGVLVIPKHLVATISFLLILKEIVVQLLIDATFLIVTSIMGITTLIIGIPLIIMAINTHLERDYLNTKLNNYITDTRFRQLLSLC